MRSASRYDAVIATLVGFLALCVSGYTAYMQRQQVRAAVWPIPEFDSSNGQDIHFSVCWLRIEKKRSAASLINGGKLTYCRAIAGRCFLKMYF